MIYTAKNGIRVNACNCGCHNHGTNMDHMHPCCDLTYQKYQDARGAVVDSELEQAAEAHANTQKAYADRPIARHPNTGEELAQLHSWQLRFAIQNVKIRMFMFAFDKGAHVYVTQEDYAVVRAADKADFMASKQK